MLHPASPMVGFLVRYRGFFCQREASRRTKVAQIYRETGNLRAVQLLLGHRKIESTVRYRGIDADDALRLAEQVEM
jgi:hypothetical protein